MPVKSTKRVIFLLFCLLVMQGVKGQVTFYYESFGTPSGTTAIASYSGWDNPAPITYTGTADVRISTPSSGYTGASGNGNIFFTNTVGRYLLISGINSSGYTSIQLSLGHYKSTTAGNNELIVEVSTDNVTWQQLTYSRATGAGTSNWILITPAGSIPSTSNLWLRFTQQSATTQFRIDDVKLQGIVNCPTTVTSFTPTSGPVGTRVTITGTNFTGATAVQFNGVASTDFTVVNDNTIIAQVPAGAATGKISVVVGCPGVSTADFTVISSDCSMSGTNLIISELCDPTNNNGKDRFIEIFNPTSSAINLAGWQVRAIGNGIITAACADPDVLCWDLSGSIAPGQALTCGYTSPINGGPHDFQSPDWWATYPVNTNTNTCFYNWNGQYQDGVALYNGVTRIDGMMRGNTNVVWYGDRSLIRNPDICSPNPDSPISEWTVTAAVVNAGDAPSTPGSHTTNCSGTHPDITTHPLDADVCAGSTVTFTVAATGGLPPYNYQWKVYTGSGTWQNVTNTAPYSGATTAALTITNVPVSYNNYQYYCQVYNADNSCYQASNAAMLNVGSGPVINEVNVTHPTCGLANGQIEIKISGGTPLYYYSIDDGATWPPVGGTSSTSYTFTNLGAGTNYRIKVKDAGCEVSYSGNPVTLTNNGNPPTDPSSISSDRNNFCEDDAGNITLTLNGGTGEQVQWFTGSCGGTLIYTGAGNTYTLPSPTVTTTYYARWSTISCGTSICQSITITVFPKPTDPTVVNVTPNTPLCTNDAGNITLTVIGGSGQQIEWFAGSCGGTPIATTAGTSYSLASPVITTTYYARWTTSGCSASACESVTVTIDPLPTTADAGPPTAQYCAFSFPLNANTPVTGTGMWSQISGATAIFNNPPLSNPSQTVTVPSIGNYSFQWTITNGSCPPSSDIINIIIDNNPTGFASSNSPVCEGTTLNLFCSLGGSGYEWYDPAMNLISTSQNCTLTNVTASNAGTYTVFVNSAICGLVSATTDVTVVTTPQAPSTISITPASICDNFSGSITLDAIGGAGGDIQWFENNACSGTPIGNTDPWIINNPPDATTNYYARYTNGACLSTCTMGTLFVSPSPAANAGDDKSVCGSMSTTLEANDPAPNTGLWTKVSGSGNVLFGNAAVYNTTVTVDQYDDYILRWTVSNTECGSVYDEVRITFSNTITAHASSDTPVCEGNTLHLYCDIAGAVYTWTGPNSFTSTVQNPFITNVTLAASGDYNVNVSSIPGGCPSTSAQTTVVINPTPVAPNLVNANPQIVCAGNGSIELTCSGGSGDYIQWYAGSYGSSVIGTGTPLVLPAPAVTTNYYADWHSDDCGNSSWKMVTVQVDDPPSQAIAGIDQSICNLLQTNLSATAVTSGTGTWTAAPGNPDIITIMQPNNPATQISVPQFGVYTLIWTVTNGVCDPDSDSVKVEFGNNIQVTAQANTPVCEGGTLNLSSSISGAATYSWTGPNSFSSNISSPSITNVTSANAGDYHLFINGIPGGCPDSDDIVHVDVAPIPAAPLVASVGLSGDLQSVCEATSVIYTVVSPVTGSTYNWALDGGGTLYALSTSDSIRIYWYNGAGLHKITVSEISQAGCTGNAADINVSVVAKFEPHASVLLNPNPLCSGSILHLDLATNVPASDALYSWYQNYTMIDNSRQYSTSSVVDGDVFYNVVTVNSECSAQPLVSSDTVIVSVLPLPEISIVPSGDLCDPASITLSASAEYPVYLWQDGSTNGSIIVNAFGSYWLLVTDATNCRNSDTITLEPCQEENKVFIPNAFTPNGDFNNDIFRVIFTNPDQVGRFNMTIYNKWGNLVFESNRAAIGWNGYLKSGAPAEGDMYTYVVTYRLKDNPDKKIRKQGLITLIR